MNCNIRPILLASTRRITAMKIILLVYLFLPAVLLAETGPTPHRSADADDCQHCHLHKAACISRHPGIEASGCAYCHRWSASTQDILLIAIPEQEECLRCHTNSDNYRVNRPHQQLTCITCHLPHESDKQYLLRSSINSLCTGNCHPFSQLGNSHPRGDKTIDPHTGSSISCTSSCHSIHTANPGHLLKMAPPNLCASCHDDKL